MPDVEKLRSIVAVRGEALRTALGVLAKRGERVAIMGAPAKLTTFLYALGLQDYAFDCVGDENPRKIGRTTPGNHLPIVSFDEMLARKPDTILIAAWNFAPSLCAKLREAGFKGGIINPMSHR